MKRAKLRSRLNISGKVFERLTALHEVPTISGHPIWQCKCSCGKEKLVLQPCLVEGTVRSCGCLKNEDRFTESELKARAAARAAFKDKTPKRKEQKRLSQMKYAVSDKAIFAAFHRWAKKRKNKLLITDEQLLKFREAPCSSCGKNIEGAGNSFILIRPRGPIEPTNMIPMCGICKLIKPKEQFDPIKFVKEVARRFWKKTPMASIAKQKARKSRGRYECNICKNLFSEKEVQLDHVEPVVDPIVGYIDLETWCRRLLCDDSNLQYLCKLCHSNKTGQENKTRINSKLKKDRKNGKT